MVCRVQSQFRQRTHKTPGGKIALDQQQRDQHHAQAFHRCRLLQENVRELHLPPRPQAGNAGFAQPAGPGSRLP